MTRNEKLLAGLNLQTAVGIEIGALDKPIVAPTSPHIFYVDHADTDALRAKYQSDTYVDVNKLVQVHGVWGEASLAQAASRVTPVDFVVASHVLEHVPDLIAWLQELASVLKPNGEVRLAIPDRRYTFDVLRAETRAADVLASHLVRARRPQAREIIDYMTHLVDVDTWKIWDGSQNTQTLTRQSSIERAMAVARDSVDNGHYHDVHCWVFTPLSFAALMSDLAGASYHTFTCASFLPTERNTNEFFVTLQMCADPATAAASWKLLHQIIAAELEAQARERNEAHVREIKTLESDLREAQAQLQDAHTREAQLQAGRLQESQAAAALRLALESALASEQANGARLESTIVQIKASSSWRITAPLRGLMALLRKARS